MRQPLFLCLVTALALVSAGCGSDDPVGPAPPPLVPITETLTGELTPNSVRLHPFAVQNSGAVTITLSEITPNDPDNPTRIGIDIGTAITQTSCQVVVSNTNVVQGLGVTATATTAGTLCARVYDPTTEGLAGQVNYVLTVTHF